VIQGLAAELDSAGIEGPRNEAERLVAFALDVSRTDLLLQADVPVSAIEAGRIAEAARRRLSGVPLQHIEGTVAFRDLVLVCDSRALVPRPETEQLVQLVVDWVGGVRAAGGVRMVRRAPSASAVPALETVLDIGTGSGAIALSLLHEGVVERAVGLDLSEEALQQADSNAVRSGLRDRIEFRRTTGSPWDVIAPGETFDVIVSNPPYVPDQAIETLPVEVRDHDPREALAGGEDGLDVVREIVAGAPRHLRAGGGLFLEVGFGQTERVRALVNGSASWKRVGTALDLAGRERFVFAHL